MSLPAIPREQVSRDRGLSPVHQYVNSLPKSMPPNQAHLQEPDLKPIDMHVHVVGNGSGGTGCWLRVTGWHRPLANIMLRHIGLPSGTMAGDLDRLYVERLLEQLRSSSLGAAVILAQDLVHDDQGKPVEGAGSFFVPNDYVLKLASQHQEVLPPVSIHPARADALEELARCAAPGSGRREIAPPFQRV